MKILLITLFLFLCLTALAQSPDLSELSKMEGGRRVLEYFKAFNTGDEQKLKTFFLENLSADSLKQRPVEPRLEFHRQIRNDFQTFEIKDLVSIDIREIIEVGLRVQGKTGQGVNYIFRFEKESPQKLLGWQIDPADPPVETAKIGYEAPKTRTEFLSTLEKFLTDQVSEDRFSGVVLVAKDDKPIFENEAVGEVRIGNIKGYSDR